jgi:hypothetical protein
VTDKPLPDGPAPRSWMERLAEGLAGAGFGRRPRSDSATISVHRYCVHCGHPKQMDDLYCGRCGMRSVQPQPAEALQRPSAAPPPGVISEAGKRPAAGPRLRFCGECGAAASAAAGFCGHCGREILATDAPVPDPARDNRAPFGTPSDASGGTAFPAPRFPSDADEACQDEDAPRLSNECPLNPMVEAAFRWWERTSAFSPSSPSQSAASSEAMVDWSAAPPHGEPPRPAPGNDGSHHAPEAPVDADEAVHHHEAMPWFQPRTSSIETSQAPPPAADSRDVHRGDIPVPPHVGTAASSEPAARGNRAAAASSVADPLQPPPCVPTPMGSLDTRPARPTGRLILGVGAAALLAITATVLLPRTKHRHATAPPAPALPGHLSVRVPAGIEPALLSVTVLRDRRLAETLDAKLLDEVTTTQLAAQPLRAGAYQLRFLYRKKLLAETTAEVRAGENASVQPSERELAEIEYEAGLRRQGSPEEKGYFERVLRLNPDHVNAHLQLAAYELVHGSRPAAERHLAAVRRLDPHNADAVALARLLRKQKSKRP